MSLPVFNPDELRHALMPTLEKLYSQEPDSLPFRDPVDAVKLSIPVCGQCHLTTFSIQPVLYLFVIICPAMPGHVLLCRPLPVCVSVPAPHYHALSTCQFGIICLTSRTSSQSCCNVVPCNAGHLYYFTVRVQQSSNPVLSGISVVVLH